MLDIVTEKQVSHGKLNSKKIVPYYTSASVCSSFYEMPSGIYFLSGPLANELSDKLYDSLGRCIWIYNSYGDERAGLLICSKDGRTYTGYCFGRNALTWILK